MVFAVPKGTPLKESDREKAERLGYPSDDQYDYTRMGNSCWFTNIEHGRRHEFLQMMTMEDNLRYSRRRDVRGLDTAVTTTLTPSKYPSSEAIPGDFDGMMGVPVTFLDRYNPRTDFEVTNADDMTQTEEFGVDPLGAQRVADYYAAGGTGGNSAGHRKLFLYSPKPFVPFKHRDPPQGGNLYVKTELKQYTVKDITEG